MNLKKKSNKQSWLIWEFLIKYFVVVFFKLFEFLAVVFYILHIILSIPYAVRVAQLPRKINLIKQIAIELLWTIMMKPLSLVLTNFISNFYYTIKILNLILLVIILIIVHFLSISFCWSNELIFEFFIQYNFNLKELGLNKLYSHFSYFNCYLGFFQYNYFKINKN